MTDIAALLERVERADDQSLWQLNRDIGIALDGLPETGMPVPNYAGSIDSALALVERCRPGSGWSISMGLDCVYAELWNPIDRGIAKTAPLAILACLLRSLTGREG